MNTLDDYIPKANKDWQLHWLDEQQPMLFSKLDDSLHLLNPVAGFIWTYSDGKTKVKAIRNALQKVFVENQDKVAKDLLDILTLWQKQELIDFIVPVKIDSDQPKTIKTFVVLGMHGSGTSLLAKALANEIYMGEKLIKTAPKRKNGFWEDCDIDCLNNKILAKAGGSWMHPPKKEKILALREEFKPEMEAIISKNNKKGLWGWKNPITVCTIDLWYPLLTNPHIITIFREPLEVSKTLTRHDKASIKHFHDLNNGIALAKEYNDRIMDFLKEIN